ncbi:hypothetical protein TcBrA4_0138780 [Trypanosoma cruzi]|nr:hypothetical protein TcBrA4_0138780 [Trypanosoma cruzi]
MLWDFTPPLNWNQRASAAFTYLRAHARFGHAATPLPAVSAVYVHGAGRTDMRRVRLMCEVGYTPNLALELRGSYQAMQHTDYDDDDDDDDDGEISCVVQRRSIEEVLTAMLKDLMSTQTTMADAPRKTAGKAAPHPLELVM